MAGGGGGQVDEGGPRKNVFGESLPQQVDLNLTALMDILSNLLFFLLASFGATIVVSINASVPVQSADKSDVADNKEMVTVSVKLTKENLEVSAASTGLDEATLEKLHKVLPNVDAKPDYAGLTAHLLQIKQGYSKSDTMILTPDPGLSYEAMVRVMDAARETKASLGVTPTRLFPTVVVSTIVK